MQAGQMRSYLLNGFWLMLPVLAINIVFAGQLPALHQPDIFWRGIPAAIAWPENIARTAVTGLPLLMPLSWHSAWQKLGLALYGIGLAAYGLAWWALIAAPGSAFSISYAGFAGPAYTPLLWLAGIALIGFRKAPGWRRWVSWAYCGAATIFLVSHNLHALLVWQQVQGG